MTIDVHVHALPSVERGREWLASVGIADPARNGDLDGYRELMARAGIERAVLLLYARPHFFFDELTAAGERPEVARARVLALIREYNRWGCDAGRADPRFVPFIGLDPAYFDAEGLVAEIDECRARGARGVKLVPPSMRAYANDRRLWPAYRRCIELGIPLLSQSGHPRAGADPYGRPRLWGDVLRDFPTLTLVLAHLGMDFESEVAALTAAFPNVYADVSNRMGNQGAPGDTAPDQLVAFIRQIGADRVLFGANYPINDPVQYARALDALPLTPEERGWILAGNAERGALLAR